MIITIWITSSSSSSPLSMFLGQRREEGEQEERLCCFLLLPCVFSNLSLLFFHFLWFMFLLFFVICPLLLLLCVCSDTSKTLHFFLIRPHPTTDAPTQRDKRSATSGARLHAKSALSAGLACGRCLQVVSSGCVDVRWYERTQHGCQ